MLQKEIGNSIGVLVGAALLLAILVPCAEAESSAQRLSLRLSTEGKADREEPRWVRIVPSQIEIRTAEPAAPDSGDAGGVDDSGAWSGKIGPDGVELTLRYPENEFPTIQDVHSIWQVLIDKSEPDVAKRLRQDPAIRADPGRLTFHLQTDGTQGFTVTVDQLLTARQLWVPALDMYLDAGDEPVSLKTHLSAIAPYAGGRTLDRIRTAPEATYEQYQELWEDMGDPGYRNRWAIGPGHIVGLTWDSAIGKFGVDRGGGVWNDYGNPDRFRLWFDGHEPGANLEAIWKGQHLHDGFPVMTTVFEQDGVRWEVEQFAYPLNGPPPERRGDIAMVLLERVRLANRTDQARTVPLTLHHHRRLGAEAELQIQLRGENHCLVDTGSQQTLLALEGLQRPPRISQSRQADDGTVRVAIELRVELPSDGKREFVVKLPSPVVAPEAQEALRQLDYAEARTATLDFWTEYETRGARFQVPDQAVNQLFRASLWHALRLPRRHGGSEPSVQIDLPYSNFAYDQRGTPWPVNQAVYVDYMIFGLRGYDDIAAEELAAIFRNNQQPTGHVAGFANWHVYTPSMLYTVAQNYLLSQDRASFELLLPASLKAMQWCIDQVERARDQPEPARGVVRGPLNDLTGDGYWAFNQAYLYAGLERFGKALQRIGDPRAEECLAAATGLRQAIDKAFRNATVLSPLVPLGDRTWSPYVPSQVTRPGRLMDIWYPTDVDTGALHLVRLEALDAEGDLAEYLLHDHEDNLFLHNLGMANEPVYNQHATAYLLRDEAEAVIRTFYSMMACAFSHTVFEPVEHRWGWGEYFGPPSTSGAWLELYRRMLIHERDDTLILLQATPRKWLEDGQRIGIAAAPTYHGLLSLVLESRVDDGEIRVELDMPSAHPPRAVLLRLRHPEGQPLRAVTVNGQEWDDFDAEKEWVRIEEPDQQHYTIIGRYGT